MLTLLMSLVLGGAVVIALLARVRRRRMSLSAQEPQNIYPLW